MNTDNIPRIDSIRELAEFWDTHDLTDFEHQLEEVTEPVFEPQKAVHVLLSARDAEAVESLAQSQGLDSAQLIRTWVLEKVQH